MLNLYTLEPKHLPNLLETIIFLNTLQFQSYSWLGNFQGSTAPVKVVGNKLFDCIAICQTLYVNFKQQLFSFFFLDSIHNKTGQFNVVRSSYILVKYS